MCDTVFCKTSLDELLEEERVKLLPKRIGKKFLRKLCKEAQVNFLTVLAEDTKNFQSVAHGNRLFKRYCGIENFLKKNSVDN